MSCRPPLPAARRALPAALLALTALTAPAAAKPADPAAAATARAEQAARAAEAARRRAETLSARLGALGQSIVARERRRDALHDVLIQRQRAASAAQLRVAAARRRLGALTAAAQRAAREPIPSVLAHPDRPLAAARAAMLLRRLTAALTAEQRRERAAAAEAASAASAAQEAEDAILTNLAALREEEAMVDRLRLEAAAASEASAAVARQARERAARLAEAARARGAVARAETRAAPEPAPSPSLAEAPSSAEAPEPPRAPAPEIAAPAEAAPESAAPETLLAAPAPPAPVPNRPFSKAEGALLWPVAGELRRSANQKTPGVAFATAARARVIAPWSGLVLFAEDFSSDGKMVIIEPQKDHLLVMVGLASVDVKEGDRIVAGEPIGRMGGAVSRTEEFLVQHFGDRRRSEILYLEIEVKGRLQDPAPWFRSAKQEVSSL